MYPSKQSIPNPERLRGCEIAEHNPKPNPHTIVFMNPSQNVSGKDTFWGRKTSLIRKSGTGPGLGLPQMREAQLKGAGKLAGVGWATAADWGAGCDM